MYDACNNANIGYSQGSDSKTGRYGVVNYGIHTETPVGADCSSLVRECVKEATGKDPGDFDTGGEPSVLEASGYFETKKAYTSGMTLYDGDVLVTKTKGHTAIVVKGTSRSSSSGTTSGTTGSKTATDSASSFDSSIAGTYTVKANGGLNLRNGAGTSKTVLATLPDGTSAKNYGYYSTVSGVKWLYIQAQYNGTTYTGFASGEYLVKDNSSGTSKTVSASGSATSFSSSIAGTYKTTANLNLRDDAGTDNKILVEIPSGTSVRNYGYYSTVSGTKWYYIQFTLSGTTYTGFASSKYLSK
ncbi:MAG: SH3 domain-containing protein [Clostridia bacterium]|nr:SH3 domain-containing protein [Clostridia bacterium]